MSYLIFVEQDHVYVRYTGIVDALDIVRLTGDNNFIENFRRLQIVIHDFSLCDEVSLGVEDMKEIALMSNIESNFSEKIKGIVIPGSEEGYARVESYIQALRSPNWSILVARSYDEAKGKI